MANCLYCGKPLIFDKERMSQKRHTECARLYNIKYSENYYREFTKNS